MEENQNEVLRGPASSKWPCRVRAARIGMGPNNSEAVMGLPARCGSFYAYFPRLFHCGASWKGRWPDNSGALQLTVHCVLATVASGSPGTAASQITPVQRTCFGNAT